MSPWPPPRWFPAIPALSHSQHGRSAPSWCRESVIALRFIIFSLVSRPPTLNAYPQDSFQASCFLLLSISPTFQIVLYLSSPTPATISREGLPEIGRSVIHCSKRWDFLVIPSWCAGPSQPKWLWVFPVLQKPVLYPPSFIHSRTLHLELSFSGCLWDWIKIQRRQGTLILRVIWEWRHAGFFFFFKFRCCFCFSSRFIGIWLTCSTV